MKRVLLILFAFLPLLISTRSFAKAPTSKITIESADLKSPIEITDPQILPKFNVWSGAGTSCTGCPTPESTQTFIVDWSQTVAEPPKGLERYQVSFYAKMPEERLIYVVFYEFDPLTQRGYVYIPGHGEEFYRRNVGTIIRATEGKWLRSRIAWDDVARPLIANAKQAKLN